VLCGGPPSDLRAQDVAPVLNINHDRSPVTSINFFVEKSSSSITLSKKLTWVSVKANVQPFPIRLRGGIGNIFKKYYGSALRFTQQLKSGSAAQSAEARVQAAEARVQAAEARAVAAEARADQERREKEAETVRASKSDGTFFLSFADLWFDIRSQTDPSDPRHADYIKSIQDANNMLKLYWPADVQGKNPLPAKRKPSMGGCNYDWLNNPREHGDKPILSQGAHLIPHSAACHRHYEKFNRFRLNLPCEGPLTSTQRNKYEIWLYGCNISTTVRPPSIRVKKLPLKARKRTRGVQKPQAPTRREGWRLEEGYLNSAANFIAAEHQFELFDTLPSIMCLPVGRSALQLWGCTDDALEFIIICSTPEVYCKMAANTAIATMSYVSCDDPAVVNAFEVFGEVMSVVIGVVCDDDHTNAQEKNHVRGFRKYLKSVSTFQAPRVKQGSHGYFLKVRYDPPRIARPGCKLKDWSFFNRHPTPDPISLMCRSFNAFSTHLYRSDKLDGIARSTSPSCKLFPSCLDMEGVIDCELCSASWLLYGPDGGLCLSPEEREKLLDVATLKRSGIAFVMK
jgi:hypothetical protein